jgi:hypothetical protein
MSGKNFFKENFVLIVGLTLPVLLMIGFMVASSLPQKMADPPKYDLVFSTTDYRNNSGGIPVTVQLVVKDGVLKAQYTRVVPPPAGYYSNNWKKLYVYEAKTQKVRELPFGLPEDMDKIVGMREETVDATKDMKLDTTLTSPDGYELSSNRYGHHGLVNGIFWGWDGSSNETRIRKGSSSVPLSTGDSRTSFYYGSVEFVGWVTGTNGEGK